MDTHNVVNDSAIWNRSRFSKGFLDFTAWPGADTRNLNRRGSTLWRPLVSVDLRTDEISSTGGHRFFAPFSTENDPLDRFPGVPNPSSDEISSRNFNGHGSPLGRPFPFS